MTNCKTCKHELRQRKDNTWQHAKIRLGIEEPESKKICDALFLGRGCMEKECKCDNPMPEGNGGLMKQMGQLKEIGENFINAVKL